MTISEGVIVGARVVDGYTSPVSGVKQFDAECGHRIWLARSSQKMLEEHRATTTLACLNCFVTALRTEGPQDDMVLGLVPGTIAEATKEAPGALHVAEMLGLREIPRDAQ